MNANEDIIKKKKKREYMRSKQGHSKEAKVKLSRVKNANLGQ